MKFVKDDGGRAAAGYKGEANDCVCRAVAIATERPYQEIYGRLEEMIQAKFGPTKRPRGVEDQMLHGLMETLGWVWVPTPKTHMRKDELPPGRLVVCIKGHAVAVVDGVIHDTHPSSRHGTRFVQGYFKKDVSVHENMGAERKKLIDTVTKMLALADSTGFEAEASTAKAKAAELIAKYDIRAESDLAGFKLEGEMRGGAAMPSYEFHLLDAVGKLCGVLVLRSGANYEFFGKPQDLVAFRYMRDITSAQQDRAWMDYLSAHPDRAREKVSWKYSFAQGVHEKVDELICAATIQQKALRQDLVLVPRCEQAKAEFECLFGKIWSGVGYGGEGNADGHAAGRKVSLNKGVKSGDPIRQITASVA
jgi:Protein of unknown function (DUF2786)